MIQCDLHDYDNCGSKTIGHDGGTCMLTYVYVKREAGSFLKHEMVVKLTIEESSPWL